MSSYTPRTHTNTQAPNCSSSTPLTLAPLPAHNASLARRFWSKHDVSLGELSVFFFHLADMGYGIVSREDNIQWGAHCCSEFTLLRIEKALGCRRRHRHLKLS